LLVQRGASLRAVAHSPAGRSKIEGPGVEAIEGDFDQPDSLERAMEDCDRLPALSYVPRSASQREGSDRRCPSSRGEPHRQALDHGADVESPCTLLSRHAEVEAHLIASGLGYTILRPACYMHVHLLPVHTVRANGTWYGMTGDGPHAYIDTRDVASVAAAVLTTPGQEGKIYELTGPRAITMPEAADQLSQVIGSSVAYVDLAADEFGSNLVGAGLPDWLAEGIVALYQIIRGGHLATVTGLVAELTGRPPRAYGEFAEAHKEAFSPS
jgi:uncharacterized protein YbjT (DUF2867 family)